MRRSRLPLSVLLPLVASAVACGGSVASVGGGGGGDGPSSPSSSSSSSSGGGSSSSSTSSSSGGGSTSSSGGSSSGTVPMTIDLCNASQEYHRLEGIRPGSNVEYMELRDVYTSGDPGPGVVVESAGVECATAADKPACVQAVDDAYTPGWTVDSGVGLERPRERFLLSTRGDSLEFQTSVADLTSFLGTIDNAKDAALLVTATDKYRINCQDGPQARKTTTGWEIAAETGSTCGANEKLEQHILSVTTNGTVSVVSTKVLKLGDPNCAIGRRPVGLAEKPTFDGDALARFFADAAYLEAASVFAFERLEAELRALGAPDDLVSAAVASQRDEVRHARMTASLARRFGAVPADPSVTDAPCARSAFDIALENAVEGCVRETYGALVAHYQARAAGDRAIACIMQVIAEDETRHASLAWDVAAWLEPRLTADERRQVETARAEAIADLRAELAKPVDEELASRAGMPRSADALALLDALDANHLRIAA